MRRWSIVAKEAGEEELKKKTKKVQKQIQLPTEWKQTITKEQAEQLVKILEVEEDVGLTIIEDEVMVLNPGAKRRSREIVEKEIQKPKIYLIMEQEIHWSELITKLYIQVEGFVYKTKEERESDKKQLEKIEKKKAALAVKQEKEEKKLLKKLSKKYPKEVVR